MARPPATVGNAFDLSAGNGPERFVAQSHRIVPHLRSIQIRVVKHADDVDNVTICRRT
jgi:hypothetical protein